MSNKLSQAVVLYMPAKVLGSNVGAHCGDCWKFVGAKGTQTGTCIEVEGDINGPHGVCGLYVNGRTFDGKKPDFSIAKISKVAAGYIESGPTHCQSCEYFHGRGNCEKVENKPATIEEFGCCNKWDEKPRDIRDVPFESVGL
jgi:hypothetical protein